MDKIWKLHAVPEDKTESLHQAIKIHKALCRILVSRGFDDFESAKAFFRPAKSALHDPFLMKGMTPAVDKILAALSAGDPIIIYGDYDVDGTTAVAMVYAFLKNNFPGAVLQYYIPHRYREGYGLSAEGIAFAARENCKLLITLDCGIKSVERIQQAQGYGIDVIVCDHHLPGAELPPAYAILNPKQSDCNYPYKELSGCGIGYKLISAIAQKAGLSEQTADRYLDLVATSIAADIVPVQGENRILAHYGLEQSNNTPCKALSAIKKTADFDKPFRFSDLIFVVAPRINAAGRMDDARKAVELFIEEDEEKAMELAKQLQADNFDRKEIDKSMTEEALQMLRDDQETLPKKSATLLFQPHWHKGVVGIVASRVLEHHYRPTIVLTESNGKIMGSARSVNGFNIYDAINECSDLLENYGGHFFAAGMTLHPDNLTAFRERFESVVKNRIRPESLKPCIEIDTEIALSDIGARFFNILRQFAPFGPENQKPIFLSRQVRDHNGWSKIVKEQHIRFVISQQDTIISGIGFGLAAKFHLLLAGRPFDIVYTIEENEWNGRKSLQIMVLDICEHLPEQGHPFPAEQGEACLRTDAVDEAMS